MHQQYSLKNEVDEIEFLRQMTCHQEVTSSMHMPLTNSMGGIWSPPYKKREGMSPKGPFIFKRKWWKIRVCLPVWTINANKNQRKVKPP